MVPGVLEEKEDVLVNVGLVDKEKAEKNVELKKKKPEYKPYEEEESVDDMVTVRWTRLCLLTQNACVLLPSPPWWQRLC